MPQNEDDTRIIVMTDEIYAKMIAESSEIPVPDSAIIMIDEVHLISLDVEFLLMAMSKVLERRPDLRLILASATCEAERLLGHFSKFSPLKVQVDGSAHQVHHLYLDPTDRSIRYNRMILKRLKEFFLDPLSGGNCLVFVPNVAEIGYISRMCSRELNQEHGAIFKNVEFLALSTDRPLDEYTTVSTLRFAEDGSGIIKRKIIFATSVAASAITLPDIRLVIISGKTEISHYDATTDATDEITVPCSKDEITQMSGKAGRTQPGLVVHCYYEEDFERLHQRPPLPSFHSDLTPVFMKRLVFGNRQSLKWFNPPFPEQAETSFRRMIEAGLIPGSDDPALTEKGLLAFRLGLGPEMTTMFEYAGPVSGTASTYASDLLLLIAITIKGPCVEFLPSDDNYVLRRFRGGLIEGTSEHLSLIKMWLAWKREHHAARGADFCEEYGLDQLLCIEIDGALKDLISQYEGQSARSSMERH
jgi:ATP-dependent helicase HrpA